MLSAQSRLIRAVRARPGPTTTANLWLVNGEVCCACEEAIREADRAGAEAWSIQMKGYGGPAQLPPTIAQRLNGGLGWFEVECNPARRARASRSMRSAGRATDVG
jgi:hypothetical protein